MNISLKGIDIVKLVMSFAVIAIHAPEYLWADDRIWPELFEWFIRLAVPFFFITSGYLIELKLESKTTLEQKAYLHKRGCRIFKLWIYWSLIYLPLSVWGCWHDHNTVVQKIMMYFEDLFLCGHSLYAQPLWFLYSMAIIIMIWMNLNNKKHLISLFIVFAVIQCLSYYGVFKFSNLLTKISIWVLGGGLPMIGGALIRNLIRHFKIKSHLMFYMALMLIIMSVVMYYFSLPFWTFFGGTSLFLFALIFHPLFDLDYSAIHQCSMWIYYIHMYIIMIAMVVSRYFDLTFNRWFMLFVICCVTWIVAKILTTAGRYSSVSFITQLVK